MKLDRLPRVWINGTEVNYAALTFTPVRYKCALLINRRTRRCRARWGTLYRLCLFGGDVSAKGRYWWFRQVWQVGDEWVCEGEVEAQQARMLLGWVIRASPGNRTQSG